MCTALTIKSSKGNSFFGRNMDLEYYFNQSVMVVPRNYEYEDKVTGNMIKGKYAIIGMGTVIDNHAAMADGMNEKGLACAGLNFSGFAYYEKEPIEGKVNIAPYDFILWVLSNHETVDEVKKEINNIELVDVPLNKKYPVPTLHWMIVDKTGKSIVVEKTKNEFAVYDNNIGVLTNNPTFDWHLINLSEYIGLTEKHPKETRWCNQELEPLGVGAGTIGIPGDFSSVSRFVRIAFIKSRMPKVEDDLSSLSQFFHMLDYVAMVKGGVMTAEGKEDFTLYSSCMNQEKGIYYYKTYNNNRINAVDINKEELDGREIKVYPYLIKQDINYQN